jgi:parallel beta-helix repeat protein
VSCLAITADFVTIDLGGFSMTGGIAAGAGVVAQGQLQGIAVRNGSISGYTPSVDLRSADGSIVEGLRVSGLGVRGDGIFATGIVKGNTATDIRFIAIEATGTVTGNYVSNPGAIGIAAGPGTTVTGNNVSGNDGAIAIEVATGSTVIGNTATGGAPTGIAVTCPSNVIDNTSTGHSQNLVLNGEGCNNSNNVAP